MNRHEEAMLEGRLELEEASREARKEAMLESDPLHAHGARVDGTLAVLAFVLAGNARFTLLSVRSGTRFTFRVRKAESSPNARSERWFVSVLTGPDNGSDYEYLGCIVADQHSPRGTFSRGVKSRIGADAASAKAFAWWWGKIQRGIPAIACEVWHLGKCGRCSRDLTVPESVASGIGPECAKRMA